MENGLFLVRCDKEILEGLGDKITILDESKSRLTLKSFSATHTVFVETGKTSNSYRMDFFQGKIVKGLNVTYRIDPKDREMLDNFLERLEATLNTNHSWEENARQ